MIDIENQVFTKVKAAVTTKYPSCVCQSMTVFKPSKFPFLCIEEADNYVYSRGIDSSETNRFAEVTYELNVFSSKPTTGKSECKGILDAADEALTNLGFIRMARTTIPDVDKEPTIYRMAARYRAVVGKDETIYRG